MKIVRLSDFSASSMGFIYRGMESVKGLVICGLVGVYIYIYRVGELFF